MVKLEHRRESFTIFAQMPRIKTTVIVATERMKDRQNKRRIHEKAKKESTNVTSGKMISSPWLETSSLVQ